MSEFSVRNGAYRLSVARSGNPRLIVVTLGCDTTGHGIVLEPQQAREAARSLVALADAAERA